MSGPGAPLLLAAGAVAGAMNAVGGGGSFVTLPALLLTGVPAVAANATSTVALCPASFASAWAYRAEYRPLRGVGTPALLGVSVLGAIGGALLLLSTSDRRFATLLPWLLLFGTLAFALGPHLAAARPRVLHLAPATLLGIQLLLGIYTGYFGGAVGILLMAVWSLVDRDDVHALNARKALVTGTTNGVAVACFVVADAVRWRPALTVLVGAVLGGYLGARLARRVPPARLRPGILCLCVAITVASFVWRA